CYRSWRGGGELRLRLGNEGFRKDRLSRCGFRGGKVAEAADSTTRKWVLDVKYMLLNLKKHLLNLVLEELKLLVHVVNPVADIHTHPLGNAVTRVRSSPKSRDGMAPSLL
ncbi:MAG: hypothetical protein J4O02_04375, partial [Chloroflexi bacterium]|nr:hypothetical protein [Chloroflexota bacterium]